MNTISNAFSTNQMPMQPDTLKTSPKEEDVNAFSAALEEEGVCHKGHCSLPDTLIDPQEDAGFCTKDACHLGPHAQVSLSELFAEPIHSLANKNSI